MYKLYRYLFLPKHCSESKWERLCLYGTKNYKEMSTEKRRRLHGMLQEGWEGLKIKHRHLSIVLKQATHWLCLMLLLAINLITRCFLGVFFRLTWSCQSYTYWGRFGFQKIPFYFSFLKYFCVSVYSKQAVYSKTVACKGDVSKTL